MSGSGLKSPRPVRQYNVVMSSVGLGTKHHCVDEDQQQLSRLVSRESSGRRVLRQIIRDSQRLRMAPGGGVGAMV